ncbi:MAG: hypothetical protein KID08_23100, partial [Pseudomonas putida]|nr:hypothetical protein [Pseudomonas putida]
ACAAMNHLIRPSFSALNTLEKLDRQQSIYRDRTGLESRAARVGAALCCEEAGTGNTIFTDPAQRFVSGNHYSGT